MTAKIHASNAKISSVGAARLCLLFFFLFLMGFLASAPAARAQTDKLSSQVIGSQTGTRPPSVYGEESLENRNMTYRDFRLLTMRDTETKYELPNYATKEAWEKQASYLRKHVLVSAGLWPMPDETPLNAHVFGPIEGEGYTIEKVYFESYPGFFVAGNLYRPKGKQGPFPGILSPHGHWKYGRTHNAERASVPARGINLARQGYVVFAYDMVGYGDTRQVDHTFAADSLSQLWGINLLGVQLRNSLRALDFITSLPDVDSERMGITGASGGATQAFLLTAIDEARRIDVTAPVNMVSAYYQGGSLCENAPGLRLDAFNVEIGALAAPRPQLMISNTHDWTKNVPVDGYPMMQLMYRLYGAEDRVDNAHFDFRHNYNRASREAVYAWMGEQLLDEKAPPSFEDRPISIEEEDLLVFLKKRIGNQERSFDEMAPGQYKPLPEGLGTMNADKLKAYLKESATKQLRAHWPTDASSLKRFEEIYGTAYRHALAATVPDQVKSHRRGRTTGPGFVARAQLVARANKNDWMPAVWYQPNSTNGRSGEATLVVAPEGKAALVKPGTAEPLPWVRTLIEEGQSVLAIDPFKVGEHVLPEGTKSERDESFEHFTTYNRTDTQERVQDVLTALSFLKSQQGIEKVNLVGIGDAGVWALLANSLAGKRIDHMVVYGLDVSAGEPSEALRYFVPGLLKIGGLRTAAALAAPTSSTIHFSEGGFDTEGVSQVYDLANKSEAFRVVRGRRSQDEIVEWLRD